jgi:protoheme IX farnesyltransferase
MAYEGDIDALMSRTANRPIPRGRITREEATAFGLILAFFSVMTLGILVNWLAGALLAFTIFFYVVIYTMLLKRWTAQNIVIGGAAGALPPVVAWAAATGSLSMEPVLLFLIIFFWTPPHFWALALFRSDDYARAGVPMLPVVAGPDATRLQILLYTIVLVAVAVAPWPLGYFDAIYGVTSLVLGGGMMALAINVYRRREGAVALRATRKLFAFSILYLFALFATLLLEVVVRAVAPAIRAIVPLIG